LFIENGQEDQLKLVLSVVEKQVEEEEETEESN